MLTEIRCDKFAKEHQIISFRSGLNTVLGSAGGSNAIGKSTFLWIIDYVFGGENYYSMSGDIRKEIGVHTIYFTFHFDGQPQYFYRSTDDPKHICRCDKDHHLITKLTLDEYRSHLFNEYNLGLNPLSFSEVVERFFRIYGRENTLEKYPLLIKPRESDEKAVDFLMKLFGHNNVLAAIKSMEEQLGIKASQLKSRQRQYVDTEKIESNQKSIDSLQKRLQELMKSSEEAQLRAFGFDTQTFERIETARKELAACTRKRNRLQSQLNAIRDNISDNTTDTASEFDSLVRFFPNTDIKTFAEIEHFHKRIREILGEEMAQEIERLQPLIEYCNREIKRLQKKIEDSGLAKELSERAISQCVQISRSIDRLEEENADLKHQLELQQARAESEHRLNKLLQQQAEKLQDIQDDIIIRMEKINAVVTEEQETAPILKISPQKEITFETPGNTSEGTAFKSLVVYDLSILELRPVPALIHDSNILKRIEDAHLERILTQYQESDRQIFIAFDKADSATEQAYKILKETAVLRLSDGHELFGRSWSKHEANE